MLNWLGQILNPKQPRFRRMRGKSRRQKKPSVHQRMLCEILEDRTAPAVITFHGTTFNSLSSTDDVSVLQTLTQPSPITPTIGLATASQTAPLGVVSEFGSLPTANSDPSTIVLGPDGNYWIAETSGNNIARMTPSGVVTAEFSVGPPLPANPPVDPNGSNRPIAIAVGPDGDIWFTTLGNGNLAGSIGGNIYRINPLAKNPTVSAVPAQPLPAGSQPAGITAADGAMWFVDRGINTIGRITVNGVVTEFSIPAHGPVDPRFIKVGSNGNLWFTELLGNKIGEFNPKTDQFINPNGGFTIPTTVPAAPTPVPVGIPPAVLPNPTGSSEPRGLVLGPDGNMWFTEFLGDKIGRITPQGVITEFQIPTPGVHPFGITAGANGDIYFAENTAGMIGVMNTSGTFLGQLSLPTPGSGPFNVERGVGNTLVVVEDAGNKIAQISLGTQQTALATVTLSGHAAASVPVKLVSTGAITVTDSNGNFDFQGVSLSLGANKVQVTYVVGLQPVASATITRIPATAPNLSADLDSDLSSGLPTGLTNDGAVSGEVGTNSAVPGVNNGIESFTAGFDNTPTSNFVDVISTLNPDGSFSFDQSEINLIAGGTLAPGAHTLHLQATDISGNTGAFDLSFTLQTPTPTTPTITLAASSQTAPLGVVTEFPAVSSSPFSEPSTIVLGPDGNYWFAETSANKIARMTPDGVITEFQIATTVPPVPFVDPTGSSRPIAIAVGPDGNIWFTELSGGKIGRITPQGVITEFVLPGPNSQPSGIVAGPDGAMWFGDRGNPNCIGRITVNGVITEFPIPTTVPATPDDPQGTADPRFIKVGSDGNIWFTELLGNKIGRIDPFDPQAGITEFTVPTTVPPASSPTLNGFPPAALSNPLGSSEPRGMVLGPDGNMWFCEYLGDKIGRITPQGVLTEFQIPTPGVHPFGITAGPNGDIYFCENTAGMIGVMNTSGTFLGQLSVPTSPSGLFNVERGIGNTLVVVEDGGNKIAEVSLGAGQQTTLATVTLTGQADPNTTVTLMNTRATTTANAAGQYEFASVPLALGANIFSVQETNGGNQSTGSETITRVAATSPILSADLDSDLSSGLATGITSDGALSGQISSSTAVPGLSNGIVSFKAGFDGTPTSKFVDVSATLNLDGSFSFSPSVINQIAGGHLAPGHHTLHLRATDSFGNTGKLDFSFTLQPPPPTVLTLAASAQTAPLGVVTEFASLPTANSDPSTIVLGPDGNYWVAETSGNAIARVTPSGVVTEFPIPTTAPIVPNIDPNGSSRPIAIAVGPDGNIWFTALGNGNPAGSVGGEIGRINPLSANPQVTVLTTGASALPAGSQPAGITAADGAMWFVDRGTSMIGRINVNGTVTNEFAIPAHGPVDPRFIKVGSNGNLWFTELLGNKIGEFNPKTDQFINANGGFSIPTIVPPALTPVPVGTPPAVLPNPTGSSEPRGLVLGPDGNMWFTEFLGDKIGFITPAGAITEFQIPTPGVHPFGITFGANGDVYFAENTAGMIGVMTISGTFLGQIPLPTPHSGPFNVERGLGNTLVVVEDAGNKIAEISLGSASPTTLDTVTLTGHTAANAPVTLLNSGTTTISNLGGQFAFTVPLSLGQNFFSMQVTVAGKQITSGVAITRIPATPPTLSADLNADLSSGLPTGITNDGAVSGQVSSSSAVPGVNNGIASFTASIDGGNAVDVLSTLNLDGSFSFDQSEINLINGSTLAAGRHTLHLQATDNFGNVGTFNLPFTLQTGTPTTPTLTLGAAAQTATLGVLTEFPPLPSANAEPSTIVLGPDGNYWIAETSANKIARMTPDGVVTEFQIPTTVPPIPFVDPNGSSRPIAIAVGPDGNIWFTELSGGKIGRITPQGVITEFTLPGPNSQPSGIVAGPDGAMWFGDRGNPNCIGRITVNGVITEFPIPTSVPATADDPQGTADPRFIKVGSDGNIWFTELLGNKIGRIDPFDPQAGITEFTIPTTVPAVSVPTLVGFPPAALSNPLGSSEPRGLVLGPDGNMWFTEYLGDKIGRITPQGGIAEFQIPTPGTHPFGITVGPNGDIYFAENTTGMIGVMNTSGTFLGQLSLPAPGASHSGLFNVERGIGNTLVVVEDGGNKIAEISLSAGQQTTLATMTLTGQADPNTTVTLLNTGATTISNGSGQFQFNGIPLSLGANIFLVQATSGGNQSIGSETVTRLAATPPVLSVDLDSDLSSGLATGLTTDPSVSGEVSSSGAVPGVSNGIVSFKAGFDKTPTKKFVDVSSTLNVHGSFSIDSSLINQIAGGTLAKGAHTLHLEATDIFGNTVTVNFSFTLQ